MEAPLLYGHVAVRLQNYVLVFAGTSLIDPRCKDIKRYIWAYNLYTEQWRKYRIPGSQNTPNAEKFRTSAVAIGTDVYMFGGWVSNYFWRLNINKNRCFTWTKMPEKAKSETPSPREGHSAWEYVEKLWIFGGCKISPSRGFLKEHGDDPNTGTFKNQLLCYDPGNNTWKNPKCFGDVPCPRIRHATATITNKIFLYGQCLKFVKKSCPPPGQVTSESYLPCLKVTCPEITVTSRQRVCRELKTHPSGIHFQKSIPNLVHSR